LLVLVISLFEIGEAKRFISLVAEGNSDYLGDMIIKCLYLVAIIAAGILIMANKKSAAAVLLTLAGGVALYNAFAYVLRIIGNEMIFGLVLGNVIDLMEIALFAAPMAVLMLSHKKVDNKISRGGLAFVIAAFVLGIGGRIVTFVCWGKSFISDFVLFFEAYGLNILSTIVMFAAAAAYIWHLAPEKRKNRR
jgi:hypothetical protein